MPSTPTTRNRLELQATGEGLNTWGSNLNTRCIALIDEAMDGITSIAISTTSVTLTSTNYATDQARKRVIVLTGTLTGNTDIVAPGVEKNYLVINNLTQGAYSVTLKVSGQTGYALRPGPQWVYCDGTDIRRGTPRLDQLPLPAAAVDLNGQNLTNAGTGAFSGAATVGGALTVGGAMTVTGTITGGTYAAPTTAAQYAQKGYVDATAFGMASGSLPGQTGNAGHFLTTDGATASWGNLLGSNNTWARAQRGSFTTLTDAATITPDFSANNFFDVTLGGNRTLENPTNLVAGQSGSIVIRQDATGSRTLAYGTYWKFPSQIDPTLTTTANAVDRLDYLVVSATEIHAALTRNLG